MEHSILESIYKSKNLKKRKKVTGVQVHHKIPQIMSVSCKVLDKYPKEILMTLMTNLMEKEKEKF